MGSLDQSKKRKEPSPEESETEEENDSLDPTQGSPGFFSPEKLT